MMWSRVDLCPVNTYLSFLLVKIVDDDTNEEVQGKEGAKDDEDNKVEVHVEVNLSAGLFLHLGTRFDQFVNCYKMFLLWKQD